MPAALAERMPLRESSTAADLPRLDAEPPRCLEVDVGRGLATLDLLRRDRRAEAVVRCPPLERRRRSPRGSTTTQGRAASAADRRSTASTAPGSSGSDSRYRASSRRTTSALISSGDSARPIASCMYRDHSGELIPIMSAWARSCQRPPRSRASCSRISSHRCSESTSTPSMSKTTAVDLSRQAVVAIRAKQAQVEVAVLAVDERRARLAFLERDDLADEERVVAGRVHIRPDSALDPAERVHEQRRAGDTVPCGRIRPTARSAARRARSAPRRPPGRRAGSRRRTRRPFAAPRAARDCGRSRFRRAAARATETRASRPSRRCGRRPRSRRRRRRPPGTGA